MARLVELPAFVAAFKACCDVKRESALHSLLLPSIPARKAELSVNER